MSYASGLTDDDIYYLYQENILARKAKDDIKALRTLEKLLDYNDISWLSLTSLINGYLAHGMKNKALAALDRASVLIPCNIDSSSVMRIYYSYHYIAEYYEDLTAIPRARAILRKGIKVFRNDYSTNCRTKLCAHLARLELEFGQVVETIALIEDMRLPQQEDDALLFWTLALAYLYEGNQGEAKAAFLFGFRHGLAEVFEAAFGLNRFNRKHTFLEGARRIAGTKEFASLLGSADQRPTLLLACCDFARGKYGEAAERIKTIISVKSSSITNTDRISARGMYYWASARDALARGDSTQATKCYLKTATFLSAMSNTCSFRLIADVISWDQTFDAVFNGPLRVSSLGELANRLAILQKRLGSILIRNRPGVKLIEEKCIGDEGYEGRVLDDIYDGEDEYQWCAVKYICVVSLLEVLAFKSTASTRRSWHRAQRLLETTHVKTFCNAVSAMNKFADQFEKIAMQEKYGDLSDFSKNQQETLLGLLSPASAIDGVLTAQAANPHSEYGILLQRIEELAVQLGRVLPKESPAYQLTYKFGLSMATDGAGHLALTSAQGQKYSTHLTQREAGLCLQLARRNKRDRDRGVSPALVGFMNWADIVNQSGPLFGTSGQDGVIRDTVRKIRTKLRDFGCDETLIEMQKGHGYRLALDPANITIHDTTNESVDHKS